MCIPSSGVGRQHGVTRASTIRLPPVSQETATNGVVAPAAPANCQAVMPSPRSGAPADRRDQTTYAALLTTPAP
jgi:hypothetical protein